MDKEAKETEVCTLGGMTQMDAAWHGILTPEMKNVMASERISEEDILKRVRQGSICIPKNHLHKNLKGIGIGKGLSTKINVNLGISKDSCHYQEEIEKVDLAEKLGAHAIMDLSNYGKTKDFRTHLVEKTSLMVGTVPVYDATGYFEKSLKDLKVDDFFEVVEEHAKDGVDFMTIHAALNRRCVEEVERSNRLMPIVSRGGGVLYAWMHMHDAENPFYEHFDRLLEILHRYDITLSLGDSLRPGAGHDSTDACQISELIEIGHLTKRAWAQGVQVMVEGPGHMTLDEIAMNMQLEKKLCHEAPFYVLGPLVTDVFPGYDHITSAIGGAIAAANGADFLCYVTPAEHLRLPDVQDVKDGIMAFRIAAHAGDLVKGIPGAKEWDLAMSQARSCLDWEEMFSLTPDCDKARAYYHSREPEVEDTCSMCGKMCPVRNVGAIIRQERAKKARLAEEGAKEALQEITAAPAQGEDL